MDIHTIMETLNCCGTVVICIGTIICAVAALKELVRDKSQCVPPSLLKRNDEDEV